MLESHCTTNTCISKRHECWRGYLSRLFSDVAACFSLLLGSTGYACRSAAYGSNDASGFSFHFSNEVTIWRQTLYGGVIPAFWHWKQQTCQFLLKSGKVCTCTAVLPYKVVKVGPHATVLPLDFLYLLNGTGFRCFAAFVCEFAISCWLNYCKIEQKF